MLRTVLLILVIATAALAQTYVALAVLPPNPVSRYLDRLDETGHMREQMRQAGLDGVARIRRMEHVCKPPDAPMQRDLSYFYVAHVAKIPDAFWAGEAARRHWRRGGMRDALQTQALRTAMEFNDSPQCPWLPQQADLDSPRFLLSFLRIASSEASPADPSWHEVNEVSMLAYDTRTSKLYYLYASL